MWLLLLALSLPADDSFESLHEEDGVTVTISRAAQGPPWVRGVGEVPAPPDKIVSVLTRYETWPQLFKGSVSKVVVLERRDHLARLHMVYPIPWPFRDRDGVVSYVLENPNGTTTRLWWRDDAKPGDPQTGERLPQIAGETRLEATADGKSRVRFSYLGELGITLNEGMKRRIWREEPIRYLRSLRRAVEKP